VDGVDAAPAGDERRAAVEFPAARRLARDEQGRTRQRAAEGEAGAARAADKVRQPSANRLVLAQRRRPHGAEVLCPDERGRQAAGSERLGDCADRREIGVADAVEPGVGEGVQQLGRQHVGRVSGERGRKKQLVRELLRCR
jgi:hypothetical protein